MITYDILKISGSVTCWTIQQHQSRRKQPEGELQILKIRECSGLRYSVDSGGDGGSLNSILTTILPVVYHNRIERYIRGNDESWVRVARH